MLEVRARRIAGPFERIPFEFYIQSPIGLVPKEQGTKTRLIFHLSYPRNTNISVNANTPEELCSVCYQEFQQAVKLCIKAGFGCFAGKSDFSSAFRHLPLARFWWKFLVMKAKNPRNSRFYYFCDKCLPFGSSISCALFQEFSDSVAHIFRFRTQADNLNYLDDFFFVALLKVTCDNYLKQFLHICSLICFPVSLTKTEWGDTRITFLGLLIDTVKQVVSIPVEKITKALELIEFFLTKPNKKVTLRQLQQLCGLLNFLCTAVVPGRAFTRRMYSHGEGVKKPHHHLPIDRELKLDLQCWKTFLNSDTVFSRPFTDFDSELMPSVTGMASDASRSPWLGAGGICGEEWFIIQWDPFWIIDNNPSITYLELYALVVMLYLWAPKFTNKWIVVFCDNMAVGNIVNSNSSKCINCMVLIRFLVLLMLKWNVKVTVRYIESKKNVFPDLLSRMKYSKFRQVAKKQRRQFDKFPKNIPPELWPMSNLWLEPSAHKKSRELAKKAESCLCDGQRD